jgi:hypothetical protein
MSNKAYPGHCSWHGGWANDVVLIYVVEGGSGAGGGAYACLDCARPLARRPFASKTLRIEVAALEERATEGQPR